MNRETARPPTTRKWWLLGAAFVVFLLGFELLENLVRTKPAGEGSTPAEDAQAAASPAPPELHRLEDGGIEIRHDLFRRSTIRLGNADDENTLFDCLERGIDQTFAEGTDGWTRRRVRRETKRIQDECLHTFHDIPVPPQPPQPND